MFITECEFDNADVEGTSIDVMYLASKSSKPSILKLWFALHYWYWSHCLQLRGINKKSKQKKETQNAKRKPKPRLLLKT